MNRLFNIFRSETFFDIFRSWKSPASVRRILTIVACVLGACTIGSANAACSFSGGSFGTASINLGGVTVPANVAPGTVIATRQGTYDSIVGHQGFMCGSNVASTMSFAMSGVGTASIYPTNISGIGIRVYIWSSGIYYTTPTTPTLTPNSWTFTVPGGSGANYGTGSLQVKVELVATGPIGDSGSLVYNVGPWLTVATEDGTSTLPAANLAVTATMASQSCSVTTSSVAVKLPPAYVGKLNSGSTGATPFNLGVTCPKGAKVNVTLTDASDISNRSTTLSLAPDSTATGVALQILNGSTPIAYGPDSAAAGNTNQWLAGTAAGGSMNIPLTAQYVRAAGPLAGGTVKGLATFTMSYQ
ncbi:hypothetical protein PQQ52_07035 [Paraburkholderia sediminicola]|uniref:fimbrial protein n=1 Tax=Paraburkholderia sediminicola TaxID=458836 RepID=UPI0038BD349B